MPPRSHNVSLNYPQCPSALSTTVPPGAMTAISPHSATYLTHCHSAAEPIALYNSSKIVTVSHSASQPLTVPPSHCCDFPSPTVPQQSPQIPEETQPPPETSSSEGPPSLVKSPLSPFRTSTHLAVTPIQGLPAFQYIFCIAIPLLHKLFFYCWAWNVSK